MNEVAKPQPSLRGLNAWVLNKLMLRLGMNAAEAAAWVIDRWVHDNEALLRQTYAISFEKYFSANEEAQPNQAPLSKPPKTTGDE